MLRLIRSRCSGGIGARRQGKRRDFHLLDQAERTSGNGPQPSKKPKAVALRSDPRSSGEVQGQGRRAPGRVLETSGPERQRLSSLTTDQPLDVRCPPPGARLASSGYADGRPRASWSPLFPRRASALLGRSCCTWASRAASPGAFRDHFLGGFRFAPPPRADHRLAPPAAARRRRSSCWWPAFSRPLFLGAQRRKTPAAPGSRVVLLTTARSAGATRGLDRGTRVGPADHCRARPRDRTRCAVRRRSRGRQTPGSDHGGRAGGGECRAAPKGDQYAGAATAASLAGRERGRRSDGGTDNAAERTRRTRGLELRRIGVAQYGVTGKIQGRAGWGDIQRVPMGTERLRWGRGGGAGNLGAPAAPAGAVGKRN